MDFTWLEDRVATSDAEVQAHFKRVHDALQAGVDVKRRVVENLRPTLLDNLGLFPALRWQVADTCGRAGLKCTERYPPEELSLTPEASIAIFRIVQEALTNILKHAQARNVEISIESRHHRPGRGRWCRTAAGTAAGAQIARLGGDAASCGSARRSVARASHHRWRHGDRGPPASGKNPHDDFSRHFSPGGNRRGGLGVPDGAFLGKATQQRWQTEVVTGFVQERFDAE